MSTEPEPPPEDYYKPCVRGYRRVNNPNAINEYFINTEPGEQPKHTTIMNVTKAEAIMSIFVSRLMTDVIKNSILGYVRGTPLPSKKSFRQPLAEGTRQ